MGWLVDAGEGTGAEVFGAGCYFVCYVYVSRKTLGGGGEVEVEVQPGEWGEEGGRGGHTAFVGLFVPGCIARDVLLALLLALLVRRAAVEHLFEELTELGESDNGEEDGREQGKGR